ncbi:putative NAD(P)H nitroreductase YfkO [compost metagenome]
MNHSTINEALNWRYATKKFDTSKKISALDWKVLQNALTMAPSSYGLQPFKFFVVENPEVREKLKASSWNQGQVTDASHYVVFAAKEKLDEEFIQKYINRIAEVRGVSQESLDGFKSSMVEALIKGPCAKTIDSWAQRQAYISMGFLMETAALLNIDACPMEGFDPQSYDKILNLEGTGWKTVSTVALGYRHPDDAYQNLKKVRFSDETLIEYVK